MKSEPDSYSIDDLKKDKTTLWEGVRNYQARNFMKNEMQPGDEFFFYHSNAKPPGIVGLGQIHTQAEVDPTAFQKESKYYDKKSKQDAPRWFCVRVKFKEKFRKILPLEDLKSDPKLLGMMVTQKGSRLSIQPVTEKHFQHILKIMK